MLKECDAIPHPKNHGETLYQGSGIFRGPLNKFIRTKETVLPGADATSAIFPALNIPTTDRVDNAADATVKNMAKGVRVALAAEEALACLNDLLGADTVSKDNIVPEPTPAEGEQSAVQNTAMTTIALTDEQYDIIAQQAGFAVDPPKEFAFSLSSSGKPMGVDATTAQIDGTATTPTTKGKTT